MQMNKGELAKYNGRDGKPAYIGYSGKVYDVTSSSLWIDGEHQFSHLAGQDLTQAMADAPHEEEVFESLPVIGILVD